MTGGKQPAGNKEPVPTGISWNILWEHHNSMMFFGETLFNVDLKNTAVLRKTSRGHPL